jgi:hypothetical protein
MKVRLTWPGGEHDFLLDIGKLRALQAACEAGPEQIFKRLGDGTWRVDDSFQTVRLGLIGGGMADEEARKVTTLAFDSHPLRSFCPVARLILLAALVGDKDDQVGEDAGETAPPANGGSPTSTEPGQS